MDTTPIVKEVLVNAAPIKVWEALTHPDKMKIWYFDLPGFKAEVGYRFEFYGGPEDRQYLHLCEIKEVIPGQKLSYSWQYDGYTGNSLVTFELILQEDQTLLRLTHEGLETFPANNPDLKKENFNDGWEAIIKDSFRNYMAH